MRLAYESLSKNVSSFVCFEITLIRNSSLLFLSSCIVSDFKEWVLVLELAGYVPCIPMDMILVSSPKFDPRYCWIVALVFLLTFLFPKLSGLSYGWSFQHLDSICPSFFQCEHEGFSSSLFTMVVLFILPSPLFLHSTRWTDFFEKLSLTFFPLDSIWVAWTQNSSRLFGLNIRIICLK